MIHILLVIFQLVQASPNPLTTGMGTATAAQPQPTAPKGKTFITASCLSDNDCESGCCGFGSGKCAGAIVALERDGGCGFGDAQPNDNAARAIGFMGGIKNSGNKATATGMGTATAAQPQPTAPKGKTFITASCLSDNDCESGCCGFGSGKCAGAIVALERDGGCGFGDAQPNDNAARAIGFMGGIKSAAQSGATEAGLQGAPFEGTNLPPTTEGTVEVPGEGTNLPTTTEGTVEITGEGTILPATTASTVEITEVPPSTPDTSAAKANDFFCIDDTKFMHFTSATDFVEGSCPPGNCATRSPPNKNPCVGKENAARIDGVEAP